MEWKHVTSLVWEKLKTQPKAGKALTYLAGKLGLSFFLGHTGYFCKVVGPFVIFKIFFLYTKKQKAPKTYKFY